MTIEVDQVSDIFNLNTYGEEIELVYNILLEGLKKNLKVGNYLVLKEKPETFRIITIDELMSKVYANTTKFPKGQFHSLSFLRTIGIASLGEKEEKDFIYLNKDFVENLMTKFSSEIMRVPLSCLILKQLSQLKSDNVNRKFYQVIRKIIFENRFFRYVAREEVSRIQERNNHFENFELAFNEQKYGFFKNIVNYFYFDSQTYKFNSRFMRDLLFYYTWEKNNLQQRITSGSLQDFVDIIEKELIKLDTQDTDKVFKGFLFSLMEYQNYCNLNEGIFPRITLKNTGDIGTIFDVDRSNKIDHIKVTLN